jgi:hypothetical protein
MSKGLSKSSKSLLDCQISVIALNENLKEILMSEIANEHKVAEFSKEEQLETMGAFNLLVENLVDTVELVKTFKKLQKQLKETTGIKN